MATEILSYQISMFKLIVETVTFKRNLEQSSIPLMYYASRLFVR